MSTRYLSLGKKFRPDAVTTQALDQDDIAVVLEGDLLLELVRKQIGTILSHSAVAGLLSTALAAGLALMVVPTFGDRLVKYWFFAKLVGALPRVLLAQVHGREPFLSRPRLVANLTYGSLILDALVWGAAGFAAWKAPEGVAAIMVSSVAVIVINGSLGFQIKLFASLCYGLPIVVLTGVGVALRDDSFGLFAGGACVLLGLQVWATGYTGERRMTREFVSREQLAKALQWKSAAAQKLVETGEQLRRESAVKTMFLGTISHELRTPLHGILGVARMMRRESQEPKAQFRLGLVESQGNHLLELIGALLDVSRIESGKLELHVAPFDLRDEVQRLIDLYGERQRETRVSFVGVTNLPDPCWVIGDAARLRQVLHNLLGNAVKFTKKGVIKLDVERGEGGRTVFTISDTGPGMTPEDQAVIFEVFRQSASAAARPEVGAGLGLTIAKELSLAMGGDVTVKSALGIGSQFEFSALLEDTSPLVHDVAPATNWSTVRRNFAGYRILLAEDNDVNAMIASAMLDGMGVATTRVVDGREAAKAACGEERPHLILMDWNMPGMDGLAASKEIRRFERLAGLARVPIVALTATTADRHKLQEAGMDAYLGKPFTTEDLLQVLAEYLGPGLPILDDENDDLSGSNPKDWVARFH